jgi:hypothetical protein
MFPEHALVLVTLNRQLAALPALPDEPAIGGHVGDRVAHRLSRVGDSVAGPITIRFCPVRTLRMFCGRAGFLAATVPRRRSLCAAAPEIVSCCKVGRYSAPEKLVDLVNL